MSANTTFLLGGYSIFRQDSAVNPQPESQVLPGNSSHASYYLAIFCVLSLVYVLSPFSRSNDLDIPFYKAGKTKWIYDAENLVRDSYNKVKAAAPRPSTSTIADDNSGEPLATNIYLSSTIEYTGSKQRKAFKS